MAPSKQPASGPARARVPAATRSPATTSRRVQKHEFYSRLMLAIRACGSDHFDAEGPTFYDAFLRAVERAKADGREVEGIGSMTRDPVFGVVHQANEMLLEAEEDRIIALLNPQLKEAHFKISQAQAAKELAETGDEEWFKQLACEFIRPSESNDASGTADKQTKRSSAARSSVDAHR